MKKIIAAALSCMTALTVIVMPSAAEQEDTLTAETQSYYAEWKQAYLRQNPYVTDGTQYYVFYGEQTYEEAQETVAVTVSEAHGYGMLIAALMADYDSDAHEIFDGMYRYYLAHPSSIGPHLMAWQQSDNGTALIDTEGADSAADGDLDIAYALLLADKVWGSAGEIDYLSAAKLVIGDIMKYEINPVFWLPQLGDWAHDPEQTYESVFPPGNGAAGMSTYVRSKNYPFTDATRSSDFTLQYFPVFASVTGDQNWIKVYESIMGVIRDHYTFYATPLLPDFLIYNPVGIGSWMGAQANFLEDQNDGNYYYNACRTPWRIGTEALLNKRDAYSRNGEAQAFAEKVNAFMKEQCGGVPEKIMAGYELTRGRAIADYSDLCFTAPLMISAAAAGDTEFHDAIRKEVLDIGVDSYYGNTIAMLCLITDDGGWLVPDTEKLPGDVNRDYSVNIADVRCLSFWLTARPNRTLPDPEAADMNSDGVINAVDLSLLKQGLCAQQQTGFAQSGVTLRLTGTTADKRDEAFRRQMQDAVTARVPDFDFSQFAFETHGMTYLYEKNDATVITGFQYYFWIYYQDYLLDPEHYEMHIRNYLDGTFETDADFLTADMQEKLAKAIAAPRIAEADAVSTAKEYAASLALPDLPDVLYQPSERFGEKPQLLVYSLEEERMAYLISDPQINRYELGTGRSAILCEVAAKVYVDAVTGEALENRYMTIKSVS